MELPVAADLEDLYRSWGFFVRDDYYDDKVPPRYTILPARTHDDRVVYSVPYVSLQMHVTEGGLGYPAVWSFRKFVEAMCDKLPDSAKNDARFRLWYSYTGKTLLKSVLAVLRPDDRMTFTLPAELTKEGCSPSEPTSSWQRVVAERGRRPRAAAN